MSKYGILKSVKMSEKDEYGKRKIFDFTSRPSKVA